MAQIVETVTGDKRLLLGNEMFGRKLKFGKTWNRIRIGIRYSFQNTGHGLQNAQFAIGVCEGTTQMFKHPSCTDWIGYAYGTPYTGVAWGYAAGPPSVLAAGGNNGAAVSRIAGIDVATTNSGYGAWPFVAQPTISTAACLVEITKKHDVNYNVNRVVIGAWGIVTMTSGILRTSDFMWMLEREDWPTLGGQTFAVGGNGYNFAGPWGRTGDGLAYSGNGLWDTVNISWNHSSPSALEIADLAVVRFT